MPKLNKQEQYFFHHVEKYQNLIRDTVQEIEDYIYSYKSTPRDELPHFSSWPKEVSKEETNWIVFTFMPALRRLDKVPEQLLHDVRAANNILFELTELNGFDEHLNNKVLSKKKINVLFGVHDSLNAFYENFLNASGKRGRGQPRNEEAEKSVDLLRKLLQDESNFADMPRGKKSQSWEWVADEINFPKNPDNKTPRYKITQVYLNKNSPELYRKLRKILEKN